MTWSAEAATPGRRPRARRLRRSGRSLSSNKPFRSYDRSGVIADLEDALAAYFGTRYAVLTSSGTAGLYSMYAACGLSLGDEVIVPAYTFFATATPLLHLGVVPILVDCDHTGNLDPHELPARITEKTKAIVVTHMWGMPAQLRSLAGLAEVYGLQLLEDGSHVHGATVAGRKIGTFGRAAAFSMNGPKPLSAGEGGFVLTDDEHQPRSPISTTTSSVAAGRLPIELPGWPISAASPRRSPKPGYVRPGTGWLCDIIPTNSTRFRSNDSTGHCSLKAATTSTAPAPPAPSICWNCFRIPGRCSPATPPNSRISRVSSRAPRTCTTTP
ncbi:DegT/DnrJ/EryC1/StrS family aminotransferase [Nocardia sp. NPDC057353]|uniref:DegT/DnrJ/EryC1/StrS family aminotransferase n=1 Tax=Nocardia sp. NPDC057353 TaxID=3346104 RepID=UPI003640DB93